MPFGKSVHREQSFAACRVVIALSFLALLRFIAPLAGPHWGALRAVLGAYLLFSVLVFGRLLRARPAPSAFLIVVHASDLLWPSLICLLTGCSNSPFFLLYVFSLLASPYRRRGLETLLISVISVLIIVVEDIAAAAATQWFYLANPPLRLDSFAVKASILVLLGGFLAYAAYSNQREQQAFATRSILRLLRSDAAFNNNLKEILPAILSVFEARKVVLVLRHSSTWRVFQWGMQDQKQDAPVYRGLSASEEEKYLWRMPAWSVAYTRLARRNEWLLLNRQGARVPKTLSTPLSPVHWETPFRTLLSTTLQFGTEWSGRLFLVDPACAAGREASLRLLQQVVDEVGPAVYNFYLWRHTSVRVRARERQRIGRDLHDGVVQSLIATEMQLELLRRRSAKGDADLDVCETLAEAQESIRAEVRKIRAEIERLRSSAVPRPLLPRLEDMLRNFERETGIRTTCSCNVREQSIPADISNEMSRILEEALSNVRRHSGARKVDVRLASHQDHWEIVIQDDGRGFGFSGRLSLAQLEAAHIGPRVIRERVHSMNGDLALESWPEGGARMEIRFALHA